MSHEEKVEYARRKRASRRCSGPGRETHHLRHDVNLSRPTVGEDVRGGGSARGLRQARPPSLYSVTIEFDSGTHTYKPHSFVKLTSENGVQIRPWSNVNVGNRVSHANHGMGTVSKVGRSGASCTPASCPSHSVPPQRATQARGLLGFRSAAAAVLYVRRSARTGGSVIGPGPGEPGTPPRAFEQLQDGVSAPTALASMRPGQGGADGGDDMGDILVDIDPGLDSQTNDDDGAGAIPRSRQGASNQTTSAMAARGMEAASRARDEAPAPVGPDHLEKPVPTLTRSGTIKCPTPKRATTLGRLMRAFAR